ncbi:MAG TPA: sigma-70 family RNA polymerase sigma factor [Myxococcales bacterium]|nr:sigma-70 family RNA polymerase sigma factor [Myxococcales bacterium]
MSVDRTSIEALYRSHGHLVLRRARLLLGSEADAQEALQEVFAALLKSPQAVRNARSLVAWLYRATTHFCLNHLRNLRTGARLLETRAPPPRELPGMNVEAMAEVRRVLALLAADVAAAVVYYHLDGMTHAEVAGLLGCSRRQVGYLLERARESLAHAERSA